MQEDRKILEENVVRPFLGLGDAVLFDCRVLHFGTENRGEIRPVIYTNYWREFYRDPKNWDERESLFEDLELATKPRRLNEFAIASAKASPTHPTGPSMPFITMPALLDAIGKFATPLLIVLF